MHTMYIRVYNEDVDLSGIVYHSNFMKYMEYGRAELLRESGIDLADAHNEGVVFALTNLKCMFHNVVFCDDIIRLETTLTEYTRYQATFKSDLYNQNGLFLNRGIAKVVAVKRETRKAVPWPENFLNVAGIICEKSKKK